MNFSNATPFNVCTTFKDRLIEKSWGNGTENQGCANFHSEFGNGCTKTKCFPIIGCINYPGLKLTARFPDDMIETTDRFGESSFTHGIDPIAAYASLQMNLAKSYWQSHFLSTPISKTKNGSHITQEDQGRAYDHFYYARMIGTPWESANLSTFAQFFPEILTEIEIGFIGLSEFDPVTWMGSVIDTKSDADKQLGDLVSVAANFMCTTGTVEASLLNEIQSRVSLIQKTLAPVPVKPAGSLATALPVLYPFAAVGTFSPLSEATAFLHDPTRFCIGYGTGNLGPLLPRNGHSTANNWFVAAQQAAYRMASLTSDHFSAPFPKRVGGVLSTDRWQVIWPPVLAQQTRCFVPGDQNPLPGMGTPDPIGIPLQKEVYQFSKEVGMENLVLAVWRQHESCNEPWMSVDYIVQLPLHYYASKLACSALNQDGLP